MSRGIPQVFHKDGLNLMVFEFVIPDTKITVLREQKHLHCDNLTY